MQYQLRWMPFKGKQVPVVLQLVNGPCPLIALCNVLLLRGKLVLRSDVHEISFEQLCSLLRAHLQRQVQDLALSSTNEVAVANAFAHLDEVSALLPKLENGLDVNVLFTMPTAFEPTSELTLFDLAGVRLMHGWCVDPEDRETSRVIGTMSYNKLVDWLTAGEEEEVKRAVPLPAASAAAASASASSVAAASSSAVPAVPQSAPAIAVPSGASEEKSDSEAVAVASPVMPSINVPLAALNPDAPTLSDPAPSPPPPLPPSPAGSPEATATMPASEDTVAVSQTVDALVNSLEAASLAAAVPVPSSAVSSPADAALIPAAPPAAEPVSVTAVTAVAAEPGFVPLEEKSDEASSSAASSSSAAASSSAASSAAPASFNPAVAAARPSAKSLEAQSLELAQSLFDKNVARSFLADTQSQLTVAGLSLLHQVMRDEELAVLFRNNHFSVLYKRNTRLYTLCTDWSMISAAGYIHWSYCNDIAGDQLFLDQDFKVPHPTTVAMWAERGPAPAPQRNMAPASPVQPHHYPAQHQQHQQPYPQHHAQYPATNPFVSQQQHPPPAPQQPFAPQLSVQQQQEQFARENGLRWNELTQNFEVLPQSSHMQPQAHQPFQHPYPQQQYGGQQSNRHAPGVEPPKKKNSCVLQ